MFVTLHQGSNVGSKTPWNWRLLVLVLGASIVLRRRQVLEHRACREETSAQGVVHGTDRELDRWTYLFAASVSAPSAARAGIP